MHRIWTSSIGVLIYLLVLILNDVPLNNAQQYNPPQPSPRPRERQRLISHNPRLDYNYLRPSYEVYTTSRSTTVQRGDQPPPNDDEDDRRLAEDDGIVDGFFPINSNDRWEEEHHNMPENHPHRHHHKQNHQHYYQHNQHRYQLTTRETSSTTVDSNQFRVYKQPAKVHPCDQSSCYPATGNLLIGREQRLTATSTCGLRSPERYCIVSHLEEKKCFLCDTREQTRNDVSKNHRIGHIIYKTKPGTREKSFWQSENGVENVTIQLDLEAEFHFTHVIIIFGTFRPAAMLIERSYDFGETWHIYRYFAHNCAQAFPSIPMTSRNVTDVVCDQRYSGVEPSKDGELIFRVLPPNMKIKDPYADHIQNMLKMTNLRIKFLRLHTLGDTLLDDRNEIQEKYYYSISSMVVRGSCSCYGHASRCLPLDGVENTYDMVHGRCECTHNTKGLNCEDCEDFYNDLPWKPAFGKQTNSCRKCNCNNHATSCHYDQAVFDNSGGISGGICDNCQHNTMGQHCEECIPFFYRDPNEDVQSPAVCKPCDCDPRGSRDDGVCDSVTDVENNIVAGSCHCKTNVGGRRCDQCQIGFWNLDEHSTDGCQNCTCNTLGTINNSGCNMYTGECTCKRYVTGKDCNQCQREFYGLSDSNDGCLPCNCHETGSYDRECHPETGQCNCRSHMTGRTCSTPRQNYYVPDLVTVLEAEIPYYTECESHSSYGNCTVVVKDLPYSGDPEWTGPGYLKTYEGNTITVTTKPTPSTLQYDIVIRYTTLSRDDWDTAIINVVRPDPYDHDGPCANSHPSQENDIPVSLPSDRQSATILKDICLEQGKVYKIKVTFERQKYHDQSPAAHILIDSIVLVPRIDVIPIYEGPDDYRRREYTELGCNDTYYEVNYDKHVRPECKDLYNKLSILVFNGATSCNCDLTGSNTKKCDEYGGHCSCKPNVVGRQCDACAPATYGFSPEGCKACDCDSIGSKDNDCDVLTGQCNCQPNTYGRECNQCQLGYWNFPDCQICNCNGHASTCDPRTGECINCQDFTTGYNCDRCVETFYGNPLLGSEIGCRPCRCPDTAASGHSFADECILDSRNNDMVCYCKPGYSGARCDMCAENYFGNPETPGGSCQECNCNRNINPNQSGNCDGHTGKCLRCLHDTAGDHCEYCLDGFFGNALEQTCMLCDCDVLGTNATIQHCDRYTGQCPCLKNVYGPRCDRCIENHWKIASGEGCEPCGCDAIGSLSEQCNPYDGQCSCNQGFGGRQCDQCQANYWGNPNEECHHCDCDPYGSASQQCNRDSGKCPCNLGMGGDKCDVCARGFDGRAPYCDPCGECFDNWDLILDSLQNQTEHVIEQAKQIKTTGATGAYTKEFDAMEKKLNVIQKLIDDSVIGPEELERINNHQKSLRDSLDVSLDKLEHSEESLANISSAINLGNVQLDQLKKKSDEINTMAADLKENSTKLQEANVEGALNLTKAAWTRVIALDHDNQIITNMNTDTERKCKRTEATIERNENDFKNDLDMNQKALDDADFELMNLGLQIPNLNELMCDGRGNPCDDLCGGAGCDKCGGLSCDEGALSRAEKALEFANNTEANIKRKEETADVLIRSLSAAKSNASEVFDNAQRTHAEAQELFDGTVEEIKKGMGYIDELAQLMNNDTASPEEIKELADKTLALELQLDGDQISNLADQISETVKSLRDVETIIENTRHDLDRVETLKEQANRAKDDADNVLKIAKEVVNALEEAQEAQEKATVAINKANADVQSAKNDLDLIDSHTGEAQKRADDTADQVNKLSEKLKDLNKRIFANELDAGAIKSKAGDVKINADIALENAKQLNKNYKSANSTLTDRAKDSEEARARAQALLQRASKITVDTNDKLKELHEMTNDYQSNEQLIYKLEARLDALNENMNGYLQIIQTRSNHYRQCSA